jgi:hypothetical protein
MSNEQAYARAIYDDIYSIYEQSRRDFDIFATEVKRKYKLKQIMLVCKMFSIEHICIENQEGYYGYSSCRMCYDIKHGWSVLSSEIMFTKICDLFIAFTPATEYILK